MHQLNISKILDNHYKFDFVTQINEGLNILQERKNNNKQKYNKILTSRIFAALACILAVFSFITILGFKDISSSLAPYSNIYVILAFISIITNFLVNEYNSTYIKQKSDEFEKSCLLLNETRANYEKTLYKFVEASIEHAVNNSINQNNEAGSEVKMTIDRN